MVFTESDAQNIAHDPKRFVTTGFIPGASRSHRQFSTWDLLALILPFGSP